MTADVVVIGAGAVGCSVAAHLLRLEPGLSVRLLDIHHVGAGSTSRSTAAFRHQWSIPAHVAFSRYASDEYDRLERSGQPIGFRRNGYLFLFTEDAPLARAAERVERQRELGVAGVEVLDPTALAARVSCGPHLDSGILAGATWGPRDGFLDPLAVAQAYLDEARNRGAAYRPGTGAAGLLRAGGRTDGVRLTDGSALPAGRVVLCAGVWGRGVAEVSGLTLPVAPAKRYLYHSRPVRDLDVGAWPMVIAPGGAHLRPAEGNTLMMAWERRPAALDPCPPARVLWDLQDRVEPGFDTGPSGYGVEILTELSRVLPPLAESVALHRATCGWYCVTPDHKAILGEDPRSPGLFHATGFSGHGIMHAAATGLTLAERLLDRPASLVEPDELDRHFGLGPLLEGRRREPVEDMVL